MKILVLTKRYTSAKDISREPVGRPHCLFAALGLLGHDVNFLLADYKEKERLDVERGGIRFSIRPMSAARILSFMADLKRLMGGGGFDVLIAEGDPLFAILARGACRRSNVPLVYDLMDNYETYDIYSVPLLAMLDRKLVRQADLVVCVTESLREKISAWRRDGVCVVGNGVDLEQFRPMDRCACRKKLELPEKGPVIGYFGYIVDYKGIDVLTRALSLLKQSVPSAMLLLAGNKHGAVRLPADGVRYCGLVAQADVPVHINACDVIVVPSPANAYTRYCFPLKVLEGLACNVPVVATDLEPVRGLLGGGYPWLVRPGDPRDLSRKMGDACGGGGVDLRGLAVKYSWKNQAEKLDRALNEVVKKR